MQVNKYLVFGILLCIGACIDPFRPGINETQDLLVVSGIITDRPGMHSVEISKAAPYNEPAFIPVQGCVVRVEDDDGNGMNYSETKPGIYTANLDKPFLGLDKSYKVLVFTPDGKEYQSDYDQLLASPRLDKLSYDIESQPTQDPDLTYQGLQFYVNVKPEEGASRNVLWKLEETFEYNSPYLIQYIWDGNTLYEFEPATDSLYTCYRTQPVREVHTASTKYLSDNELSHYPLNYVSNQTIKLRIKYSLLVSQYSLSDEAFLYWDKIKTQLNESGGLYETQPSGSAGNIYNVNDPEEKVLGFFYASQVTDTRLTLRNIYDYDFITRRLTCDLKTVNSVLELGNKLHYMVSLNEETGIGLPYGTGNHTCFNCAARGDTLEAPEFWYNDD